MDAAESPAGDLTFLFSDIEGSTVLLERLGPDRWTPILSRHRELLRAAWTAHGGSERSTEGDSFFVVFPDPAGAIGAAAAAQRALAAEPWPDALDLRVRMGIHAGHAVLDPDGSYVGHDVHRAARITGAANGGQVLVSEATAERAIGRFPPGVALRPLGEHRLKDLRPERLALLVIEGVPAIDTAIRSLDARPNNLPTQLTTFVGRERELDEARDLLGRTRLLTITGPGGTGKTRLSLQLAASVADRFPDGTWFVPLATIRDPELLLPAIARAMDVTENPVRGPVEVLVAELAGKRALLVLDNLEQVLAGVRHVAELLRELPLLHVLATSRAPLRIAGEQEYPLHGLPIPIDVTGLSPIERATFADTAPRRPVTDVIGFEAVRLFLARASAVKPGFQLTEANADDIAGIVAHLGGIPLAIELAAARIRFLTPAAIRARLDGRLDLPGTAMLDVPERQQTLRAAIAWSYELLDPPVRRMFTRLGAFAGGFDLECAERVCGPASELGGDVLDALSSLVDHSLVLADEAGDEPRFAMLEPIREFAVEQLAASGEEATTRDRHARAMLELAARAEPELAGPAQRRWLDRLELDHANLRAAIDWAEGHGDAPVALGLAVRVWRFWQKRGHLREARTRVERLLAEPWAAEPTTLRGDLLEVAGGIAYWHGEPRAAEPFYEECLAIRRASGDSAAIAHACYNLSFCFIVGGMHDATGRTRALTLLEEALERYRALDDDRGTANALWGIGCARYFLNDNEGAIVPLEESLELYRKVGDRTQEGWALHQLGSAKLKLGEHEAARTMLRDGLRLFREAGDLAGVTVILDDLSASAVADEDLVRGARLHGLARRLQQTSGTDLARYIEEAFEEQSRRSARQVMSAEELARHAAEGRAMTLDDGVRYALGEWQPEA